MKFFLLGVLCLGLALAVPDIKTKPHHCGSIQEISFRPGKEYVYRYDTQVLTGLSKASQLQAGFRLSCIAHVQFQTASQVVVQLDKIVLYRINEPIVLTKASESLLPGESLKELVGDEASSMEYFLKVPFGFVYDDGEVRGIILEDQETTWSANLKRGFVALFEVNLDKRYILDESYPAVKSPVPPNANWYNVLERSTTGNCVTLYTVTPSQHHHAKYVTKTRDYERCLDRPVSQNSIIDGYMVRDARKDNPLINGATVKYSVKGNDKKFIILSAVGESHIVFTPYKNEEEARTSINQTLNLREARFIGHEVQPIRDVHQGKYKKTTIKMTLPSCPVDCRDPFFPCHKEPKQINEQSDVYSVEKILMHLKMAAGNNEEITNEEGLQHLRIVKDMLKRSPHKILKDLWDKVYIAKVNPQADINKLCANIYWNILPSVGTEASANAVLDICATTDLLYRSNCSSALQSLALRNVPTPQILDKLIKLTQVNNIPRETKQSAYLALGSFGHTLTHHLKKYNKQCEKAQQLIDNVLKNSHSAKRAFLELEKKLTESRCSSVYNKFIQSEEKIIETIKKLLQSPKEQDKLLALKSLGNSGLPRIHSILQKYLDDVQQPNMLRVEAVIAHRRIFYPQAAKQQAIKILLKKYLTTSEKNEIRSHAFLVLSKLNPEQSVLETVATSLRHEKDSQVSSLVHSFLTAFANSTYDPDKYYKQNCSAALKFAPELPYGLEHSFWKRIGHFSQDYKRGQAAGTFAIGDISRYFSSAIYGDTYNYGLVSYAVQAGINTEGLSSFLNKLFGPQGLITKNKSWFDLLRRAPRDVSPQQQIQQIFKKLRIEPRTMPTPQGHLYINVMDNEVKYVDFSNLLQQIVASGSYPITWDQEGLRVGLPVQLNSMYNMADYQLTLSTEAGLPVSLKAKVVANVNIEGEVSVKVIPYLLESDRQGQAPFAVQTKVDLKPKIAAEVTASMGLDNFYVKPAVGFRGLVKYNAPIQNEVKVDLAYKRLNIKFQNPALEKPVVEMLLEPYSEFLLITKKNESPVQMNDRRNLFASDGSRTYPVSVNYKINILGYRLALTGQLPVSLRKTKPFCPTCGRSLINVFWKPLNKDAPRTIELNAQKVLPIRQDVSNSYTQNYQQSHTVQPTPSYNSYEYERAQSGALKFDKFGRPVPQSVDEILPYSDPVDIQKQPINMQQLCNKFQKLFSQPMPFYNEETAGALVVVLDASSQTAKRQVQLESVWRSVKEGRVANMYNRLWRSSIPDYDSQEWQLLNEVGVSYPVQVSEPKDIFNPQWQRQLMNDLEYLISLESHKVPNQQINMTILSQIEQHNYPSMVRIPTKRIIDSLVPEQLYTLMNITSSTIYNRRWDNYWRYLLPVYMKVSEDVRVNVDANFVNEDLPLVEYLTQVLKVQSYFQRDLNDIIEKTVVAHAELPIIQYINYIQARTVYLIREIFHKAIVSDRVHQTDKINGLLQKALENVDTIVALTHQVVQQVTSVSQRLNQEGRPIVVFKPEVLRQTSHQPQMFYAYTNQQDAEQEYYQYGEEQSYYNTDNNQQQLQQPKPEDLAKLRMNLYNLTIYQADLIEQVQLAISNKREVDHHQVKYVLSSIRNSLNIIDQHLMKGTIKDPVVRQRLLLVTVQNEITVELLEEWKKQVAEQSNVNTLRHLARALMLFKEEGIYLGERASILYHKSLLNKVVVPNLTKQEFPIYKKVREIKRQSVPELRELQMEVAYNVTNMKKPEVIDAAYKKFEERVETHLNEVIGIEKALVDLGQIPKLYIMSELMDALHYLKYSCEFASRALYSVATDIRFSHLSTLEQQTTSIQTLIAALSPIFNKYTEINNQDIQQQVTIVNTLPIDTRILDVQDVIAQQKIIQQQLYRVVHNPDVSLDILEEAIDDVIDRLDVLQETLKQNDLQVQAAVLQRKLVKRQAISAVWSQALNQQRNLYEALLNILQNHRDSLSDVTRNTERINALERDIAKMEDSHKQMMNDLQKKQEQQQNQPDDDDWETEFTAHGTDTYSSKTLEQKMQQPSQRFIQRQYPYSHESSGINAVFNFTWGNGYKLDKNASAQFVASRNVEQIMYLYRQMQAVVRSQDIVNSINRRLSQEPLIADSVMQRFNTYNHWHLISQAKKEQIPQYFIDQLLYLQDFLKAKYWYQFQHQNTQILPENTVQLMVDISDFNKKVDLYMMQQNEANIWQGISISDNAANFPVIQNYRPLKEKVASYLTYNHVPAECKVNKEKVYTFDGVNYQLLPYLSQKEVLLAADCSQEKSFAITIEKANSSLTGHILKIMNEDKIVEIIPGYWDVEVRVNGEEIELQQNVPYYSYKSLHYDLRQVYMKIVRKGQRVDVDFQLAGIQVVSQGSFAQVKVSQLFKRKLCGLCSNFDNQRSWEYEGPSQEVYSSPRLFAQSYILEEQDRHSYSQEQTDFSLQNDRYQEVVSEYRPKGDAGRYKDDVAQAIENSSNSTDTDDDDDDDDDQQKCQPQPETIVKYVRRKVCFSVTPVDKCPPHCFKATETKKQKVKFVCMSRKDARVYVLEQLASEGPIPNMDTVKGPRKSRNEHFHVSCPKKN